MPFDVTFTFVDSRNRKTTRRVHNTQALIADALTDVTTLAALWDAVTNGGLQNVTLTQSTTAENFAAVAGSNVDENCSVKVEGGDGFNYDFDLTMPPDSIIAPDARLILSDAAVIAFFAAFDAGDTWRINNRNPTPIAQVIEGVLDT